MGDILITNNRLRKIRCIMKSHTMNDVYGVVIPPHISKRWVNTYVRVRESGGMIILESGALPVAMKTNEVRGVSRKLGVVVI